ncbi:MAG TPA: hypothetical protein VFS88_04920 [Micavibrio sp.]|nr:hypothetical protein [Micavibrio sp.]
MIYRNAAGMIALAAFLFAAPVSAQETVGGRFYADCWIADGAATTIVLDNHIRMNLAGAEVKPNDAYRTAKQVFEGESQTMQISLCDAKMDNCRDIEGVLSTYEIDESTIEGTLEYFDGTEVQGDSESIEGHVAQFKAVRGNSKPAVPCD